MSSRRQHCGQTFVGSDTEKCSLCQRTGGLVDPAVLEQQTQVLSVKAADPEAAAKATSPKWVVPCFIVVLLLLLVGGIWFFLSDEGGLRGDALTKNQLKRIWLVYNDFGDMNNRKAPSKIEDLAPFLRGNVLPPESGKADRDCYEAIQSGKYMLVLGLKDYQRAKAGSNLILAYETKAKQTAGFAIFADFRIERLSHEQLEKFLNEMPKE